MKHSMTLKIFLKRILFAVLVIVAALYVLLATQTGLNFALNIAQRFMPGQLRIAAIRGNLISHLSIQDLKYTDGAISVSVKNFDFSWNAFKILLNQYDIQEIRLNGAEVNLPVSANHQVEAEQSASNESSIDGVVTMLAKINIERAAISDVTIYQDNKPVYQVYDLVITRNQDNSHALTLLTSFGKVTGTYQLDYFPGLTWSADLVGEKINLDKLNAAVTGTINFHVSGHGKWSRFSQQAFIDLADLNGNIERNQLKASATVDYADGQFSVKNVSVRLGNAILKLTGKLKDAWDIRWNLDIPDIHQLVQDGRGTFTTSGQIGGGFSQPELTMQLSGHRIRFGDVSIQSVQGKVHTLFRSEVSDSGAIVFRNLRFAEYLIPKVEIKSASWLDGKTFRNKAQLIVDAGNTITSDMALPKFTSFTDFNQPIKGVIHIDLTDLSRFTGTLRQTQGVKSMRGRLVGVIDVSGKLEKPVLDAKIQLTNGSMFADKIGLDLTSINMNVNYRTAQPVVLQGSLLAGDGRLNIDGRFNIDAPQLSMSLNVDGSNLQVMDSKEYKIRVTPHINLSYRNNDLFVKGTVDVPYALIEPTDFSSTVTLPSDVVIVNKKSESAIPTNVALDVQLQLGNDVHIKYQDLKTQLLGGIRLSQLPGNPPTAVGELSIRTGTYKAYGKLLQIEEGRLIYTGNLLSNPGISLRASTKVNSGQLTVGVNVNGTLDKPLLSLFANPSGISQGDILSYILFGTPQSDSSAASGLALLNVATGMAGGGESMNPLGGLTSSLGLNVDTGTTQYIDTTEGGAGELKTASTVGVGKNIGHDITIHYGMSLFEQAMTFSLRYQLSRRFAIQTETSTLENGGDIFYSMESAH